MSTGSSTVGMLCRVDNTMTSGISRYLEMLRPSVPLEVTSLSLLVLLAVYLYPTVHYVGMHMHTVQ